MGDNIYISLKKIDIFFHLLLRLKMTIKIPKNNIPHLVEDSGIEVKELGEKAKLVGAINPPLPEGTNMPLKIPVWLSYFFLLFSSKLQ